MKIPARITARWLKSKGACSEQVNLFKRRYPNGVSQITGRVLRAAKNAGLRVRWMAALGLFKHSASSWDCAACGRGSLDNLAAAIRAAQRKGGK